MSKPADAVDEKSNGEPKPRPQPDKGARPSKILPSERTQFTKQLDILRAFDAASAHGATPAKPDQIEAITQTKADTIRMGIPFFVDVGFLLKGDGGGYTVSRDVANYGTAYDHNPETAGGQLAPTLRASWFMRALEPKLSFRPTPEEEVIETLAVAATAGAAYKRPIRMLLDYLIMAGLVVRDGNLLKLNKAALAEIPQEAAPNKPSGNGTAVQIPGAIPPALNSGVIRFQINVNVDMQQMGDWEEGRIKQFFEGLALMLAANKGNEPITGSG